MVVRILNFQTSHQSQLCQTLNEIYKFLYMDLTSHLEVWQISLHPTHGNGIIESKCKTHVFWVNDDGNGPDDISLLNFRYWEIYRFTLNDHDLRKFVRYTVRPLYTYFYIKKVERNLWNVETLPNVHNKHPWSRNSL